MPCDSLESAMFALSKTSIVQAQRCALSGHIATSMSVSMFKPRRFRLVGKYVTRKADSGTCYGCSSIKVHNGGGEWNQL